MPKSDIVQDFLLGFIKIHILHHASTERIYGQEFREELARHGYSISFGTLYPIFHRMENSGFLTSERETVRGKVRKYYRITRKGEAVLAESRKKAKELFDELYEHEE
ncbi:MAG TPA: PadR family transcriptional regulator [Spirochaetota bacterium]|mgnify:CR=1 FL=1|jgi:DNA-binding PadR family transcriptional regulator|nr:PadR family transcriptional regulator [Spirochaetota bacterium]HPV41308.1 PadR family transcriptional regulator [Spirochaetota bacterium]